MILDMKTILFSNAITDIVCLVVIVLLWQQNRKRFSGTGFFVINFILQTVALFLIISRDRISDWMSIVLANTMVIAGALLGYIGLTHFAGKKSPQVHNYILLAAFAFIHAYFTFVQPDLAARNFNLAVGLLIICWQCAWLMLYRTEPDRRPLTRGVGMVFAAYCVVSVIRIIDSFTAMQTKGDFFQSGILVQLILISHQMLFILLTYALVLMFNKALLTDVKTEEEKFSKAFHSSPYAIAITRLIDGKILEVNEGFSNSTGYQPEEIKGKKTPALHLWEKDEERDLVVNELNDRGKVQQREFSFRKKSGELITGLFSAEILTINNEQCILSSINDITGRKQTEDALQIKNLVFDTSIAANSIADAEGIIVEINDSFLRLWGYTGKDEIIGNPLSNFFNDINEADVVIASLNRSGHWQGNFAAKKKDGSVFIAYSTATIIQDKNGRITGYQSSVSDITEHRLAESQRESALKEIYQLNIELENKVAERTKELHNSQLALLNLVDDLNQSAKKTEFINRKLDETNKELAAFSYSVSHDLRAPLRSIDGFSLALLEDYPNQLDDRGRSYLNKIRAASQRMGSLIEDLLKLSRITHAEFRHESFDLSKIVQSVADTLQQNNPDRDVQTNIQKDILINGDRSSMEIAMTNLLENAWKFTGKQNNPFIEFGMNLSDGKRIFFVRDNGVGFDMAYANKLFGAFQRLHRQDEFPGTGIGLATVKRIISRHGGQIWVEGEVGKGATFFFTLPE